MAGTRTRSRLLDMHVRRPMHLEVSDRRFAHIVSVLTSHKHGVETSAVPAELTNAWLDEQQWGASSQHPETPLSSARWLHLRRSRPLPAVRRQPLRWHLSAPESDIGSSSFTASTLHTLPPGGGGPGLQFRAPASKLASKGAEPRARLAREMSMPAATQPGAARQAVVAEINRHFCQPAASKAGQQRHVPADTPTRVYNDKQCSYKVVRHIVPPSAYLARARPSREVLGSLPGPVASSSRPVPAHVPPARMRPAQLPSEVDVTGSDSSDGPAPLKHRGDEQLTVQRARLDRRR